MPTPTPSGEKFDTTQQWCPHCSGDNKLQGHCNHTDVVAIESPEPGAIIASDYEYISLLGSGGMGVVYKCRNIHLDKVVAVKMLLARRYGQEDVVRFQKEARAAGKFKHPNLVSILDFGIANDAEPFMVMEYLEGVTLDRLIDDGDVSISELISIFIDCCIGLAYAHEHGVLHRDLKPANIMIADLGGDSIVKVLDFGIAKIADAGRFDLTVTGNRTFGTPSYMSPEQSVSDVLTNRCDVYSLGCVMYEAFTGHLPFEADSALKLISLHQTEVPVLIGECRTDLSFPEDLEVLISSMLLKKPKLRPAMKEIADDLIGILEDERTQSIKAETVEDGLSPREFGPRVNREFVTEKRAMAAFGLFVFILGFGLFWNFKIQNENKREVRFYKNETLPSLGVLDVKEDDILAIRPQNKLNDTEMSFADRTLGSAQLKLIADRAVNCTSIRFINCPNVTAKNLEILRPRKLKKIVIRGSSLTNDGLEVLSTFSTLNTIGLEESTNIDSSGIAKLKRLPNLLEIAIREMPCDKEAIKSCSEMKLKVLELTRISNFDEQALAYLKNSSITELRLKDLNVTDSGFELVSKIPQLTVLYANRLKITDRGLASMKKATKIIGFSVANNKGITNQSAELLVSIFERNDNKNIAWYGLDHTSITSASVPDLKKLKGINSIEVSGLVGFNSRVLTDLRKALPGTNVVHQDGFSDHMLEYDQKNPAHDWGF